MVWLQSAAVGSSLPHVYSRSSVPRAAFSHSASLGSRVPDHSQNACTSTKDTWVTGWSSLPSTVEYAPRGVRQVAPSMGFHQWSWSVTMTLGSPTHTQLLPCFSAVVS